MSMYPNPFTGPGECRGGNGYCAAHGQPVLACENERLLAENVTAIKRAEQAEAALARVREAIDKSRRETASDPDNRWCRNATIILDAAWAALEGRD